jgi:hypothetical protein
MPDAMKRQSSFLRVGAGNIGRHAIADAKDARAIDAFDNLREFVRRQDRRSARRACPP